jgi:hypothetical protein
MVSLFSGDNDEGDSDKQVLLRQTAKELAQNKYAKFYRVKSEELDPSFGLYFYTIYKIIYPLQSFLKNPLNEEKLKLLTIESFLDKQAGEAVRRLNAGIITAKTKPANAVELSNQLQENLTILSSVFDHSQVAAADRCYDLVTAISRFARYDFVALLNKFDPTIVEGSFVVPPKFINIKAEECIKEIADFISSLPPMDSQTDWKTPFDVFKTARKGDLITLAQWTNIVVNLRDLKLSRMLELIIRYTAKNPIWDGKTSMPDEHLAETWLEQKKAEIQGIINEIAAKQRNSQMSALVRAIFGEADVIRLNYYNDTQNNVLVQKNLEGFVYASGLNYLYAFIQDYLQKEIQEICDIILIRGQWASNSASLQMSDAFHGLIDIIPQIDELDTTLSESGLNGSRLRAALLRIDRDKTQVRHLNSITGGIDEEALDLINSATQDFIIVGKHVKALLDDHEKKPYELIINWKELENVSKISLGPRLADAYKKINYFVQLMALVTHPVDE